MKSGKQGKSEGREREREGRGKIVWGEKIGRMKLKEGEEEEEEEEEDAEGR